MKSYSVIVLTLMSSFGIVLVKSNPQIQSVTVKTNVPDFFTEATPTESTSTISPEKLAKEKEDERFRSVKGLESSDFWIEKAQTTLKQRQSIKQIEKVAKNVIYFVGDGMSVPTVAAARILKGQLAGSKFGEETQLHMEQFPYLGASKTFCSNAQVADSACSATALFTGSKTNYKTIGVSPKVLVGDCKAQMKRENHLSSILEWAQKLGKSTGIVTTTRITHATPAGTYAHIAHRDWESDAEITKAGIDANECDDIAEQLVFKQPGRNINVILGGGRKHFLPSSVTDPESGKGSRNDSKNLIDTWKENKQKTSSAYTYVETVEDLLNVDTSRIDYLLGLFSPDHIEYSDNITTNHDPSLLNMTNVAIKILSKNPKGFFLMVEGGRIDHALHDNMGQRALLETIEFDRAIEHADKVTKDDDTLITVTADHSHVMSIAGYPVRGNPILGIAEISDMDGLPYTTISFANGPGFRNQTEGLRHNVSTDQMLAVDYKHYSGIPLKYETHGGDDVFVFSKGPYSHYLTGVFLQNYLPHLMAYASCIAPAGLEQSHLCQPETRASAADQMSLPIVLILVTLCANLTWRFSL